MTGSVIQGTHTTSSYLQLTSTIRNRYIHHIQSLRGYLQSQNEQLLKDQLNLLLGTGYAIRHQLSADLMRTHGPLIAASMSHLLSLRTVESSCVVRVVAILESRRFYSADRQSWVDGAYYSLAREYCGDVNTLVVAKRLATFLGKSGMSYVDEVV